MEIRTLKYFLTIANEKNISKAAESLYITQPTLSRQIQDLEKELGKQLFIRGSKQITLTDDGVLFKKRAEEIMELVNKTTEEIASSNDISGEISIGTGESDTILTVLKLAKDLQNNYPNIKFNFQDSDSIDIFEKLDNGLIDFGITFGDIDKTRYNYKTLPQKDRWGILCKKNDHLFNNKKEVTINDLLGLPIIMSRQLYTKGNLPNVLKSRKKLHIVNTYNLIYNAILMCDIGMGYVFTLENLVHDPDFIFIPYVPKSELEINVIWKKNQIFNKSSKKFLELIEKI